MRRLLPIILAGAVLITGCSEEKAPPKEIIRPVLSMIVEPRDARQEVLVGSVEPQVSAQLAFRLLGRIVSREVDVGDLVTKGATIASLDPAQLQLQVQGARANVASALAQAANANASEERQRMLLESKNTPQAVYDTARQARDSANAGVEQAQAALAKAEEQLGYAQLFSDFDGVVTATGAEVGQVVSPGQMVVTVARADQRDAVVDIPAALTSDLTLGTSFTVSLQSAPSIRTPGKVREIAPQTDAATGTRRVRLALEGAPIAFRLGSTVSATRDVAVQPTIQLPPSALVDEGGQTYVWVVQGDAVQRKEIKVASASPDGFTVTSGLDAGERVVTAGVHSLKEGQKVKLDGEEPAQ